jgi:ketosteroid isomerase-like protein
MSIKENKALVRRYFEDARENPDICEDVFAPVFLFHTIQHANVTSQVIESTPKNEKASYEWLKTVWGDWHMTVDEMIAEGHKVMVCWTFHGRQQAEYLGLPPTNKCVIYSGINIFRVVDGKIVEIWDIYDRLWLWQQLGVLPDIKEAIMKAKESVP